MSKITKSYDRFKPWETLFRCPICVGSLAFQNENSLICERNHCFDLSRHGYINFAPGQGETKYKRMLFESRRAIFQKGFYDPIVDELRDLINRYSKQDIPYRLLDAGCGEGVLLTKILKTIESAPEAFGLDLSKDAILLAGKQEDPVKWIVGDLANIPLQTGSMGILLNILTPANYSEFARVLASGGILIKAVPGANYLRELRNAAKMQLHRKEYSNENVLLGFEKQTVLLEKKQIRYQVDVNAQQVKLFAEMTPMLFDVEQREMAIDNIKQITIEMEILVGRNEKSL